MVKTEIWRTRKLLSCSLSARAFLAGQVLLTVRTVVIVDIWRAVVQITSVGERATIVRTTTSVELESVAPRTATARRHVQMASAEITVTFARTVHNAVLESAAIRMETASTIVLIRFLLEQSSQALLSPL